MAREGISLLLITSFSLPLIWLNKLSNDTANVVVFIPPPVEPGEAPIHINASVSMNAGIPSSAIFILLKPAVLGVVALKNETTILPNMECSLNVLSYSVTKNKIVPVVNKIDDVISIIRVFVLVLFNSFGETNPEKPNLKIFDNVQFFNSA